MKVREIKMREMNDDKVNIIVYFDDGKDGRILNYTFNKGDTFTFDYLKSLSEHKYETETI